MNKTRRNKARKRRRELRLPAKKRRKLEDYVAKWMKWGADNLPPNMFPRIRYDGK